MFEGFKLRKSLPARRTVHGVAVTKMSIGRMLEALVAVEEIPRALIDGCFDGRSVQEMLAMLASAEPEAAWKSIAKAIVVLPGPVLTLASELMGVERDVLTELSLAEFAELLAAFWEVNRLGDFFTTARRLATDVRETVRQPSSAS
jgi:hypothetical protein